MVIRTSAKKLENESPLHNRIMRLYYLIEVFENIL